jgi:hypothetical protein
LGGVFGLAATRFLVGDALDALRVEDDGFAADDFGREVFVADALLLDAVLLERTSDGFGVGFFEDFAMRPLLTLVCRLLRELRALRDLATRSGRFHPMARSARNRDGIWSTPSP